MRARFVPLDGNVLHVMTAWPATVYSGRRSDKPATSFKEAIDVARVHEGARLAGGTVSAVSYTHPPTARSQSLQGSASGARSDGARARPPAKSKPSGRCTSEINTKCLVFAYEHRHQKKGRYIDRCFARRRDEEEVQGRERAASKKRKARNMGDGEYSE